MKSRVSNPFLLAILKEMSFVQRTECTLFLTSIFLFSFRLSATQFYELLFIFYVHVDLGSTWGCFIVTAVFGEIELRSFVGEWDEITTNHL